MTLRAGIYGRQSHDATKSINEQTAECERDATAQGWKVAARYSDGVSASRHARKARTDWPRLLADLDAGRLGALVLWESSRGDRTLTTWSAMLDLCRARGVLIRVTTHGRTYDMANARDWRTLAEDGVDSAYESEKTSARNRRATAAQAAAGRPHGPVRYGYERVYDPATRALLGEREHPAHAAVVRDIVRRIGRNVPVSTIVRDLNDGGVPSPSGGRWHPSRVRAIAGSPTYAGIRMHKGERHPAIWPALVTEADHLAALRVLGAPERKTTRPGRQAWMLSYLVRGDECGCGLGYRAGRQYRGRNYKAVYGCAHVTIDALELDALILDVVAGYLADADLRPLTDDGAAVAARTEANALRLRLAEWRDSAAHGETTPATMAHIETELAGQIRDADRRAVQASTPAVLRDVLSGARYPEFIRARLAALPAPAQREIIGTLLSVRVARAARRLAPGEPLDVDRVLIEWR